MFPGRTGRFGRKGISINFVHDKKTWLQMEQIEMAIGRKIIRIETNDLDEMEEVRPLFPYLTSFGLILFVFPENEESLEVGQSFSLSYSIDTFSVT